jgi:hypothetical protein
MLLLDQWLIHHIEILKMYVSLRICTLVISGFCRHVNGSCFSGMLRGMIGS